MSAEVSIRHRIDDRGKRFSDYIGVPLRHASLPHAYDLTLWMDAGLLVIDVDGDRLIAGPKA